MLSFTKAFRKSVADKKANRTKTSSSVYFGKFSAILTHWSSLYSIFYCNHRAAYMNLLIECPKTAFNQFLFALSIFHAPSQSSGYLATTSLIDVTVGVATCPLQQY